MTAPDSGLPACSIKNLMFELEQLAAMYGENALIILHGPDGTQEGGFFTGLQVSAIQMTDLQAENATPLDVVLLEGKGNGSNVPGNVAPNFKWSYAARIVEGRGLQGPHGDYPPGS